MKPENTDTPLKADCSSANCSACGGAVAPGVAIPSAVTDHGQSMWSGLAPLVSVLKCQDCGHSFSPPRVGYPNHKENKMKTAHQFAKELLEGPDYPIVIQLPARLASDNDYDSLAPPCVSERAAKQTDDPEGPEVTVLEIGYKPKA